MPKSTSCSSGSGCGAPGCKISIIVEVPLERDEDAEALLETLTYTGWRHVPYHQQRRVARRMGRFVSDRLTDRFIPRGQAYKPCGSNQASTRPTRFNRQGSHGPTQPRSKAGVFLCPLCGAVCSLARAARPAADNFLGCPVRRPICVNGSGGFCAQSFRSPESSRVRN
jgi:hypothetical protein